MTVEMSEGVRRDLEALARRRRRFVVPLLLGSLGAYALALLAFAYWPAFVRQHLIGAFNVAYLLAAAQFVMTFAVGAVYSRWAARVSDPLAERIRAQLDAAVTLPAPVASRPAARADRSSAIVPREA